MQLQLKSTDISDAWGIVDILGKLENPQLIGNSLLKKHLVFFVWGYPFENISD